LQATLSSNSATVQTLICNKPKFQAESLPNRKEIDCIWTQSLAKHSDVPRGLYSYMDISTRQSGTATIVDVVGDITLYNSPDVRKVLLTLLKEKKAPRVIVNMEKVRYIDSAGVASLVEGLKVSRDMKSTFALYGLSKTAQEVFELTRLVKVFEIYKTEEDALRGGSANTNVAPVR
jgi:anti-sigma B factor antagonist